MKFHIRRHCMVSGSENAIFPWLLPGLLSFWALVFAACGQPTCVADQQLGSCCKDDSGCQDDLNCLTQFPAGLCSHDCEQDRTCPEGGRCLHIISKSRGDLGYACLRQCGSDWPSCRADYKCRSTSEEGLKVCFPD